MSTTIQIKRSSTASAVPLAGDLEVGELAVNLADKRLFTKKSDGTVVELSTNPTDIDIATLRIDGVEVTASAAELNSLDGSTATTADLNKLAGVTATSTELNLLDGVTATTAELNFVDGVTSNVQTQLDNKQPLDAQLTDIAGLTPSASAFIVGSGTNFITQSGDTAIASLGVSATASELNVLDGITATTTELNYTDGVTSNIQTQLNTKAPIASPTFTGTTTIPTVDINGGNIDGVQIGTTSPNAGVFSTLNANSSFEAPNIDDNATKVDLKNGGATKLSTTATGVDVTGTVTADGLTVNSGATNTAVSLESTDSQVFINLKDSESTTGHFIGAVGNDFIVALGTTNYTARFASTGDVHFYEDTGTTAKFVWDSSAESLGIGTASPAAKLDVNGDISVGSGSTISWGGAWGAGIPAITGLLGGLRFYPNGSTSGETMRIDSSGNVGIGTSSPNYKLEVNHSGNDKFAIVTNDEGNVASETGMYFRTTTKGVLGVGSGASLAFEGGGTERLRIDSSGNVGIGTASPSARLEVTGAANSKVAEFTSVGGETRGLAISTFSSGGFHSTGVNFNTQSAVGAFSFSTGGSERARIDSSGNLLVGTTDTNPAGSNVNGVAIRPTGYASSFTGEGGQAINLNRKANDGDIARFYKDGSTVGSIGTFNNDLHIGHSTTGIGFNDGNSAIIPTNPATPNFRDNAIDLGIPSVRFKDLYLSGGVYLGGTGSANKLDDYETGNWTPTLGGTWISDPTNLSGTYVKIGKLVYIKMVMSGGVKANTTSAWLTGLPFNVLVGSTGSVVNSAVTDNKNCLLANGDRVWLTETSFSGTTYITATYETNE